MLIKIQSRFDNNDYKTATQAVAHEEMWINPGHIVLVSPHPTIFNALEITYGKDHRRLVVCRDHWMDVASECAIVNFPTEFDNLPQEIKDLIQEQLKGYQFTTIIDEDGRTLESFPRGLAGLEVRVTVLGDPMRVDD